LWRLVASRSGAFFIAAALLSCSGCSRRDDGISTPAASPSPATQQTPAADDTIASTGLILGVGIGTSMADARAMLDPLRAPAEHEPDAKEQAGTRVYWKLAGTEYDWIIAWANKAGQITRIRANPPPEKPKPFAEIGDPAHAASIQPQQMMWNVERPGGMSYRLIAQGNDRLAKSVYMFALNLDMR
jgi:hypothetical protein